MKVFFARALVLVFPCVAMAQIAVLQIKVIDGEGAVHPLGSHIAHPLTVEVTDDNGRPVAGAAVSFQLPPEGPSGLFSNGLRTDLVLTDSSGRASVHPLQLNRTGGPFRIRITAVKEQARAGTVSTQYIGGRPEINQPEDNKAAPAVAITTTPAVVSNPPPVTVVKPPPAVVKPAPEVVAKSAPAPLHETAPTPRVAAKSGEITPTTTKMSSGRSHKKWIILAVIVAAGAGAAFVGFSRAKGAAASTTVSSGTVSIGAPTLTVGNP